jgi:hypothetical protein
MRSQPRAAAAGPSGACAPATPQDANPICGRFRILRRRLDEYEFLDRQCRQGEYVARLASVECDSEVQSLTSRPSSRHSSANTARRSRTASTPARLNPYQPSPHAATRRSAASLLPLTTMGICRPRTGFGLTRTDPKRRARRRTTRRPHARPPASPQTYSAVRLPRRANGTPSAANSSRDQPIAIPRVSRPLERVWRLAACLASNSGVCSGSSSTPVAARSAASRPRQSSTRRAGQANRPLPSPRTVRRPSRDSATRTCQPSRRARRTRASRTLEPRQPQRPRRSPHDAQSRRSPMRADPVACAKSWHARASALSALQAGTARASNASRSWPDTSSSDRPFG